MPVPDVLLVEEGVPTEDGKEVAIWVHQKVEGESLLELRQRQDVRSLTVEAGELLARVHSVDTSGFGWLNDHGHGESASWTEWMTWDPAAEEAGRAAGLPRRDVDEVNYWLEKYQGVLARTTSHLLHGDWGAVHVLARGERVVSLIDFGSARAGDAAYDIARWDLVFNVPQHPTADIIEGYTRIVDLGPDLEVRRALCALAHVRYLAPLFAKDDRAGPLALMQYGFAEALASLREHA